jgi:hypothetical protein
LIILALSTGSAGLCGAVMTWILQNLKLVVLKYYKSVVLKH